MKFTTPLAFAAAMLISAPAFADETAEKVFSQTSVAAMQGDIVIEAPYAVAMKEDEILVFMTIHNGAKADDVITSVSSEAAEAASLADYEGTGDARKTTMLEKLDTPGNNAVMMEQNGLHVVLSELKEPVEGGDTIPLTLTFAETGDLTVEVSVAVLK
jgi:copper(I)-binding protein